MMIIRLFLFLTTMLMTRAAGQDLPLADLGADSLALREKAEATILEWATKNQEKARKTLRALYQKTEDPERRRRLLRPLERAYFPPKGYVGFVMSAFQFDPGGNFRRPNAGEESAGVSVSSVVAGTPAEKAGLQVGDRLLKIDDWEVGSGPEVTSSVAREIQKNSPGTELKLTVRRDGELREITLRLGLLPVPSERIRALGDPRFPGNSNNLAELAAEMEQFRQWLNDGLRKEPKKTDR